MPVAAPRCARSPSGRHGHYSATLVKQSLAQLGDVHEKTGAVCGFRKKRIRLAAAESIGGIRGDMGKKFVALAAALLLCGCSAYFDRHPANIRPESEAVATVLARQRPPTQVAEPILPPSPAGALPRTAAPAESASAEVARAVPEPVPAKPAAPVVLPTVPSAEFPPPAPTVAARQVQVRPAEAPVAPSPEVGPLSPRSARPPTPGAPVHSPPASVENTGSSTPTEPPASSPAPTVATEPVPEMSPPAVTASAAMAVAPLAPSPEAHCEAVARQRAADAAADGLDRETQEIVHSGAYADCIAWARAHPPPP